ncbi:MULTISPECIES: kynureninase [unclassified Thermoactinomyces]|jgi:kynureninase|uniref:kynureninase n=1 Tax=unclassified Thermoactinomyces TaxID=2634588 RepID=UPI0018DEB77D|nr:MULTISPECIES: kynureninase [unclassified Thermoactinomyces]MBH8597615.1 kynureninase [Thermoactinomyces sp. CICC 10523]MBH8603956.1 kynureninase [Thermoactinomyces sp. CICC 10522]
MELSFSQTREYAEERDQRDELRSYRREFYIPEGVLYMDGNSLGLLSKRAERAVMHMVEAWKQFGIDGWTEGDKPWFYLAEQLGGQMAPLVGAKPHEVVAAGSTTTNLHQLLATFYRPCGNRTKIVANELDFPTDIYAIKSIIRLKGLDPEQNLIRIKSEDGRYLREEEIISAMTEEVALVLLPTVLYRSGQLLNVKQLTEAAREKGILIGFDACHSIGAVLHQFHAWQVDFAVWCTYKYLNSGPGGVAGLYVHEKHHSHSPGLAGWFGSRKDRQFDMDHTFEPAGSAGAYQTGTPHILSMAPLSGSLEMFAEAGMERIRKKSLALTEYLMQLIRVRLDGMGFTIGNPVEEERRGGHVALEHVEAVRIAKALKAEKVIPDFRSPNVIRLAPVALYTSFADVWDVVDRLKRIMEERTYERFQQERGVVA